MPLSTLSLLIIEDNLTISSQLKQFFEGLSWSATCCSEGKQALDWISQQAFDVVLLDLNLPDIDGIDLCRMIKAQSDPVLPVLMLTARDAFGDKASGFGEGADDYVTKPFDFRELALRCEALARRQQLHQCQVVTLGDLVLDRRARTASREGQCLKLTRIGFNILDVLAEESPRVVGRSQLLRRVWGDTPPDSDALRSHIYALRQALDKPFSKPMLTTIVNIGFRLDP